MNKVGDRDGYGGQLRRLSTGAKKQTDFLYGFADPEVIQQQVCCDTVDGSEILRSPVDMAKYMQISHYL